MEEAKLLRQYYYENIDPDAVRDFNSLTEEEILTIKGMWGFAFFKAKIALDEAKKKVIDLLPKN